MAKRKIYRKKPKKRKLKFCKKGFRFFIKACFVGGILVILGNLFIFTYFAKDLPDPEAVLQEKIAQTTKIYDRTGKILLYEIHGPQKRTILSPEEIPDNIKHATVAIEDERFYQHAGIDIPSILRALWTDIKRGKLAQGGSTITQQFIKNRILTPKKSIVRKIKEIILALELEREYSKDEILTFYLNQVPYGRGTYGIEAAAQSYFGKPAKNLTLPEAATLAALPKAPSYLAPEGSHPEALKARQEYILERMYKLGYITKAELNKAKKAKVDFVKRRTSIKAPHFVMYVREYLEKNLGPEIVQKGGLRVKTTLNWKLQKKAEEIVKKLAKANQRNYNAENASLVALDPQTGEILAMVGSRDWFDDQIEGKVNVALRPRQPGSAFKPFAYAQAFEKGFTPQTIIFDVKTEFNPHCRQNATQEKDKYGLDCYHPTNYDHKTRGPVSFRSALAQSLNIPSVKVLYLAGIKNTITKAKKAGISTFEDEDRLGLSLVLGGAEVKLLDLTSAYSVFSQDGYYIPPTPIIEIKGLKQEPSFLKNQEPRKVFSKKTARAITDILSDNQARAPMFGESNYLSLPGIPSAAKTGTTQDYRDGWTIGYTPNIVAGVWVGNNDNSKMRPGAAGAAVAAPIWNEFMKEALKDKPHPEFAELSEFKADKPMLNGKFENKKIKIDSISGKLATKYTPPSVIKEKSFKKIHTILYYADRNNPRGPRPSNPTQDPQFENWEYAVQKWISTHPERKGEFNQSPPQEKDDIHIPENFPEIEFTEPEENEIITNPQVKIKLDATAKLGLKQVEIFIDNYLLDIIKQKPWEETVTLPSKFCTGDHKLLARAYDKVLNSSQETIDITTEFNCSKKEEQQKQPQLTLSLSQKDFPKKIKLEVKNLNNIKKASFYYYKTDRPSRIYLIGEKSTSSSPGVFNIQWEDKPQSGKYKIYAQILDKHSNIYKSNEVSLEITNN